MWLLTHFSYHDGIETVTDRSAILMYTDAVRYGRQIDATIEECETGQTVDFCIAEGNFIDFFLIKPFKKYNPYGFGEYRRNRGSITSRYHFVEVSRQSYEFLHYVDSVDSISINEWKEIKSPLKAWMGQEQGRYDFNGVRPIDKDKTLFEFTSKAAGLGELHCTLLEAIQLCPEWWYDDEFYLFHSNRYNWNTAYAHRVKFSDVQAAKRFIVKSAVLGENKFRGLVHKKW